MKKPVFLLGIILIITSCSVVAWNPNPLYDPFELIWNAITEITSRLDAIDTAIGNIPEVCDDLDNNGNGEVDEYGLWSNKGDSCSAGVGACNNSGVFVCNPNNPFIDTICNATPGIPVNETCDGLDNDCDGEVDEDFRTFEITTCCELQLIKDNLTGNYTLMNDINCSDTVNWNSGQGFQPLGGFSGNFDGNGHIISGLYINRPYTNTVGLFGTVGSAATIKDVGLEDVSIKGNLEIGGLAGINYGIITTSYVANGNVDGRGNNNAQGSVGGLVGANYGSSSITNCYADVSVSGKNWCFGGLAGATQSGSVTNSYAVGSVSGQYIRGGLIGCKVGSVTNSFATGASGLYGADYGGGSTNSYWDNNESYFYYSSNPPLDVWDFVDIWGIDEGVSLPYLLWE